MTISTKGNGTTKTTLINSDIYHDNNDDDNKNQKNDEDVIMLVTAMTMKTKATTLAYAINNDHCSRASLNEVIKNNDNVIKTTTKKTWRADTTPKTARQQQTTQLTQSNHNTNSKKNNNANRSSTPAVSVHNKIHRAIPLSSLTTLVIAVVTSSTAVIKSTRKSWPPEPSFTVVLPKS